MRFRYTILGLIALSIASASAEAQSTNQNAGSTTVGTDVSQPVQVSPFSPLNAGTLAEYETTTALAMPTYHQDDGLFYWLDNKHN